MNKEEMLRALLAARQEPAILDLLRYATSPPQSSAEDDSAQLPEIELVRLIGGVRAHLRFVGEFGHDFGHAEDGKGGHHFAYPDKLEAWLHLDAPGLSHAQVRALFEELE